MSEVREQILTELMDVEKEIDELHQKRHNAYTRDRQAIDEEMRELRIRQLKLREKLSDEKEKTA